MKFLVDNQLPRSLAGFLAAAGHDAVHVLDLNLGEAEDSQLWETAAAGRVIVTKDEDFVDLVLLDPRAVPVIHVCLGNCRNAELLAAFRDVLPELIRQLEAGEMLVELF